VLAASKIYVHGHDDEERLLRLRNTRTSTPAPMPANGWNMRRAYCFKPGPKPKKTTKQTSGTPPLTELLSRKRLVRGKVFAWPHESCDRRSASSAGTPPPQGSWTDFCCQLKGELRDILGPNGTTHDCLLGSGGFRYHWPGYSDQDFNNKNLRNSADKPRADRGELLQELRLFGTAGPSR